MTYKITVGFPGEKPAKVERDTKSQAAMWVGMLVIELIDKAESEGSAKLTGIEILVER
jgi:hypothetical protein